MTLVLLIAMLLAFLVSGLWIPFALGVTGLIMLYLGGHTALLPSVASIGFNTMENFVLTSVPLFLLMGEVILRSGLSTRFYRGVAVWVAGVKGELLHSNILASAIFSAVCGSSTANAAAIGTIAIPELMRRGYNPRMIYGTIAAGGALGNLIPPGIATIIYGAIVEESVAKLFIACVIPGIMVTAIFHIYVWLAVHVRPALVPVGHADPPSLQERWTAVVDVFPVLALMTAVLGSLWFGIATPTESAGVGVTGAVLLALLYRGLTWAKLRDSLVNTVRVTCMLLFIILGAQILSFAFVRTGINRQVSEWVVSLDLSHWALLAVIAMLYITLGMLVDGISMMLLTLPVLYPVVINAGFDPIWFGVILVTLIEVGQITPPVGMVLFVIQGIARCSIGEVSRGALPFVLLFLVGLVLMALFPETATWLPSLMR